MTPKQHGDMLERNCHHINYQVCGKPVLSNNTYCRNHGGKRILSYSIVRINYNCPYEEKIACKRIAIGQIEKNKVLLTKNKKLSIENGNFCKHHGGSLVKTSPTKACETTRENKKLVIYTRIDSLFQRRFLTRQIVKLNRFCKNHDYHVCDIGSLDKQRRGLIKLISLIKSGVIGEIVVTHIDRLEEKNSEVFITLAKQFNVKITSLDKKEKDL